MPGAVAPAYPGAVPSAAEDGPRRRPPRTRRPSALPWTSRLPLPPARLAAVLVAFAVSAGVFALSGAGRTDPPQGQAVPRPVVSAAPTVPAAVAREIGRLRVDLAVARATWEGATRDTDALAGEAQAVVEELSRAIEAASTWLDAHDPLPSGTDDAALLLEVAAHRELLAGLVARLGVDMGAEAARTATAAPAPTAAPTARPTRRASSAPRSTPAPRTTTPAPEAPPTPAPTTAPPPEPTADPTDPGGEPTTPAPAPTTPAGPAPTPADPVTPEG